MKENLVPAARAGLVVVFVALVACGGSSSPTEPAAPTPTPTLVPTPTPTPFSSLSGVISLVEKDGSRAPAVGATIRLEPYGGITRSTDATGFYVFAPGYVSPPGAAFTVSPPLHPPLCVSGVPCAYSCPGGTLAIRPGVNTLNFDCSRL